MKGYMMERVSGRTVVVGKNVMITKEMLRNDDIVVNQNFSGMVWNGKWKRTTKLPDDRFTTWVEDYDLENPESWMIYFGLVEKVMVPGAYVIDIMRKRVEAKLIEDIFKYEDDNRIFIYDRPVITSNKLSVFI